MSDKEIEERNSNIENLEKSQCVNGLVRTAVGAHIQAFIPYSNLENVTEALDGDRKSSLAPVIEGVPKGWRIKGILKAGDGDSVIDSYGKVITLKGCNVGYYHTVVERDVQVIDMSKCLVDVEYFNDSFKGWFVCDREFAFKPPAHKLIRVRQDHYFGWRGGECPLPDGVRARVFYRAIPSECLHLGDSVTISSSTTKPSELNWNHKEKRSEMDIIGFEVLGSADTHVYAHELNTDEN